MGPHGGLWGPAPMGPHGAQYSNILAILREFGANTQYQSLESFKTILWEVLTSPPQHQEHGRAVHGQAELHGPGESACFDCEMVGGKFLKFK